MTPVAWTDQERQLIAAWGYDLGDNSAATVGAERQLIGSVKSVCEAGKDLSQATITAGMIGMDQEKVDRAVQGQKIMCPRDGIDLDAAVAASKKSFKEGQWQVGTGSAMVAPGKYKSLPVTDGACYWERLDANGKILANDIVKSAPGGVRVTIQKGDDTWDSQGCGGYWIWQGA